MNYAGRNLRRYNKAQLHTLMGGGDLVSDAEKNQIAEQTTGVAKAALGAQSANLNRATLGGSLNQGQVTDQTKQIADAQSDALTKAGAQQSSVLDQIRERRRMNILSAADRQREIDRRRFMDAQQMTSTALDIIGASGSAGAGAAAAGAA